MRLRTDHGGSLSKGSANNEAEPLPIISLIRQRLLLLNLHNQDVFVPNYRELA